MLSVSTMALAAMLGSGCGTNMANVNTYNPCQYNQPNCPKNVRIQKSGQNLDSFWHRWAYVHRMAIPSAVLTRTAKVETARQIPAREAAAAQAPARTALALL